MTPNVFANNRLSLVLLSMHPMSAKVDMATREGQRSAAFLPEYLVDPNFGHSMEANRAPFQYTLLKDTSDQHIRFFDWLNAPVCSSSSLSSLSHRLNFQNQQQRLRVSFG